MDLESLISWLREEMVLGWRKQSSDPWDGGFECAIEEAIRHIPEFPDPPPILPPMTNDPEENGRISIAWRQSMYEWCNRQPVSALGDS